VIASRKAGDPIHTIRQWDDSGAPLSDATALAWRRRLLAAGRLARRRRLLFGGPALLFSGLALRLTGGLLRAGLLRRLLLPAFVPDAALPGRPAASRRRPCVCVRAMRLLFRAVSWVAHGNPSPRV